MKIHTLRALKDNFVYLLEQAGEAVAIDPGEAAPVFRFLEKRGLRLRGVLCTHHHHDHVDGAAELAAHFDAEVWCSAYDRGRIAAATRGVRESEALQWFGEKLRVLEVPGHTLGQIAFWWPGLEAVFPGDTLFSCGCGRLREGTPAQMFSSLSKLKALPPQTRVYFGHEYTVRNVDFVLNYAPTPELHDYRAESARRQEAGEDTTPSTIARELALNPLFNAQDVEEFKLWRERRDQW